MTFLKIFAYLWLAAIVAWSFWRGPVAAFRYYRENGELYDLADYVPHLVAWVVALTFGAVAVLVVGL